MPYKVAVLQSNYIPWKGYFDLINDVDLFIFYDDVQYTKNDWRNRNKIKTPIGSQWLTIPVGTDLNQLTCEVKLKNPVWHKKHWKTIQQYYSKSPFFYLYQDFFQKVYLDKTWHYLSEINQYLIKSIAIDFLGITTEFKDSREYNVTGSNLDRLINLLQSTKADIYISGPSAKNYIDEKIFNQASIQLEYKDYSHYPEYPQRYPPFDHHVSIIDLLFNCGEQSSHYIWGGKRSEII